MSASMAAVQHPAQNIEAYSDGLPYLSCVAQRQLQREILHDDASRIFSGCDDVEVWLYHHTEKGIVKAFGREELSLRRTGIVRNVESIELVKSAGS